MPTHNFTQFLFAQTHKTHRHNLHKLNSCRPAACHAVMQTQLQTPRNTTVICANTQTRTHNLTQFKLSRRHANSTLRRKYSRDLQQEMGKLFIYISYMMNYILIVIHVSLQLNIEIFRIQAK